MANEAIRELRRRRIALALFRQGRRAPSEQFRGLDRQWDVVYDQFYTGDWMWLRECIKPAYEDPARMEEDAEGPPATVISPTWLDSIVFRPWEDRRRVRKRKPRKPRAPRKPAAPRVPKPKKPRIRVRAPRPVREMFAVNMY